MSRVMIGINVLEHVNRFAYTSHIRFFSDLKVQNPDDQFLLFTPYRMAIDTMRNATMKQALDLNCDYVFFIDDDMVLQKDTYNVLKAADKDIIMALTHIRGYPFPPMFFKSLGVQTHDGTKDGIRTEGMSLFDDYKDFVVDGLVKCAAVGFACTLIKTDVIKALPPPWCLTGPNHTEDVYFCNKARYALEPEPEIFVSTKCPTGHMMMSDMVIDYNVEKLRELYAPDKPLGRSREERINDVVAKLSEAE